MSSSSYIANQHSEEADASLRRASLAEAADVALRLPDSRLPPLDLVRHIGCQDLAEFRKTSAALFREVASRLRIRTDANLLDLGCGCGRLALPFVQHLQDGYFHGVDTWAEGVDWCNRHLRSRRAAFQAVPSWHRTGDGEERALPWIAESSIDAAVALSIFTNVQHSHVADGLAEIGRVLKPGALAYITFFRIDRHAWRYINATGRHADLIEEEEGCFYSPARAHRFAGYVPEVIEGLIDAAGLRIVSFELGEWAQKPGARNDQDTFIVEKPAPGESR